EEAGQVEVALDDESYPPRKVYSITPSGRERFLAWVREPVPAMRDMRVEFLAKLYFFHNLELGNVGALLEGQKRACQERLYQLEQGDGGTDDAFQVAVHGFRRRRVEASLDWLREVEREWA
ncbi:MAG: hypothetical protein PVH50_03865, partial [Anaerolineae bacterium]